MHTREDILEIIKELYESVPGNGISPEAALEEKLAGLRIFDAPIAGFGSADDELFERYKAPGAIGPWFLKPREWFPEGETVVSMFFPFTEEIRAGNRLQKDYPSGGWLHGRIEGQAWLTAFMKAFAERLAKDGTGSCVPLFDPRWQQVQAGKGIEGYDCIDEKTFSSRWSERHAAFVCGLGTFGLSKGVITRKGMAGRFTSIIIPDRIEPDVRAYTDIYEWCVRCGACAGRCPVDAITPENGKDHNICYAFQLKTGKLFYPRYGCGLCQTKVPCEARAPGLKQS